MCELPKETVALRHSYVHSGFRSLCDLVDARRRGLFTGGKPLVDWCGIFPGCCWTDRLYGVVYAPSLCRGPPQGLILGDVARPGTWQQADR